MRTLHAIKQGVWTSKDRQRTMTVKYNGHSGWVDVEEFNRSTKHCQQIKVGKDGFNQFEDQLIDGGWVFTERQRKRRNQ